MTRRELEVLFWQVVALGLLLPAVPHYLRYTRTEIDLGEVVNRAGLWVMLAFTAFLFPILFRLIFFLYPFEFIRNRLIKNRTLPRDVAVGDSLVSITTDSKKAITAEDYLSNLATESKNLSERIYRRSGAYLLVGCLVAFTGLLFFYLQSVSLIGEKVVSTLLLSLAPRFGILFFIELIAFFFLKQYRITMDEFRYFESLKRQRQSNLAVFRLAEYKREDLTQAKALIEMLSFVQSPDKLSKEETTELLESRKFSGEEINIFQKIIETIGQKAK